MKTFNKQVELSDKKITEDKFNEIRNMITECQKFIDSFQSKGKVVLTGARDLQEMMTEHGTVYFFSSSLYNSKSCFAEIDGVKLIMVIHNAEDSKFVTVASMQSQQQSFSMRAVI